LCGLFTFLGVRTAAFMLVLFNQNTDCSYRAAVDLIRKACTSKLGYDFLATYIQNFQKN